jgi:hypothetical protein
VGHTFLRIVVAVIGFIYLHLRYRNRQKVLEVVNGEYEGHYSVVGMVVCLNVVAGAGFVAMVALVLLGIFSLVKYGASK